MQEEKLDANLTLLMQAALGGDQESEHRFYASVYDELRRMAARIVGRAPAGSVTATVLVHELYDKLFRRNGLKKAPNRRYFYTVAMDQMRRLLIDHHRKRTALKAGGQLQRTPLDESMDQVLDDFERQNGCTVEDLEDALKKLKTSSGRQYQVVVHRFYGGLTNKQTAKTLGVSLSTIEGDWRLARAKRYRYLNPDH